MVFLNNNIKLVALISALSITTGCASITRGTTDVLLVNSTPS